MIHRDIKPSNILRTPTGEAKVIDLGLALQAEFEDERVTREGTTVGTVDYMAPEQARDSRATSVQSDIYSLGCTFYYLLAGIPPYPGGDITDKLTRHARSPAPDIRDLRPDIPAGVAAILLRMMAKPQEDRFADYDALIGALDAVRLADGDEAPGVALVPLEDDAPGDWPAATAEPRAARNGGGSRRDRDEPGDLALESPGDFSLALADERDAGSPGDFSLALADERDAGNPRRDRIEAEGPLPRLGRAALEDESDDLTDALDPDIALARRGACTMPAWVFAVPAVCVAAVVLAIVLHRSLSGSGAAGVSDVEVPDPYADLNRRPEIARSGRPPDTRSLASPGMSGKVPKPRPTSLPPSHATPKPKWVEPEDNDPIPGGDGPPRPGGGDLGLGLPEWTRAPNPARSDDPVVTVRRFAGVTDGTTKPTLQLALNGYTGGAVELADDGPLLVDDLRMSGESRVIRARRGYRPIIRILRSHTEAVREHSAFVLLDRKSLTIEGIDLLVDARELSGRQKALFGCSVPTSGCGTARSRSSTRPMRRSRWCGRSPRRALADLAGADARPGRTHHAGRAGRRTGRCRARRHGGPDGRRWAAGRAGHAPGGGRSAPLFREGAARVPRPRRAVRSRRRIARPDRSPGHPRLRLGLRPAPGAGDREPCGLVRPARQPSARSSGPGTATCTRPGGATSPTGRNPRSRSAAWRRCVPRGARRSRGARKPPQASPGRTRATRRGGFPPSWTGSSPAGDT